MNELIKKRRKELKLTLEQIGVHVGVSKATVQRWESGQITDMGTSRVKKLSEILQLDPEIFIDGEFNSEKPLFVKIPVLGSVAAGVPVTAQENVLGYEEIPASWVENASYFALKIKGDSMEPRMADGDIVIVKKQDDVENGEVAIVLVGNEEATCKKVMKHSDAVVLISNNAKYQPMFFTVKEIEQKPVKILGRVVELRARF